MAVSQRGGRRKGRQEMNAHMSTILRTLRGRITMIHILIATYKHKPRAVTDRSGLVCINLLTYGLSCIIGSFMITSAKMLVTGYMQNHMRMYWGKKVLEWSVSPEEGYASLLRLNNTFFIDGRDANSYANVGWIFGLHDRPWPEQPIQNPTVGYRELSSTSCISWAHLMGCVLWASTL